MVKKIISFVLLFLLIISFTLGLISLVLNFTVFNESYIVSIIEKNQYYSKTYNTIMEKFKDNTVQSGLEESILDGIITEKQVEEDTLIIISNIYENNETKVDTEIIKTRLREKINKVVEQNNKKVTNEEQEAINIYINTIENIYEEGILYKINYIDMFKGIFRKIDTACPIVLVISCVATLVLLVIIGVLNKKESIKYYSIGLISTGILLIIPKIIETMHINANNVLLFNLNISNVVINTVENMLIALVVVGIICIILGILINIFEIKDDIVNSK